MYKIVANRYILQKFSYLCRKVNTMAKKKKIVEEHKSEPVTNCDQSKEVVTNCDNQQFAVTIGDHKNIDIKSMIRVIRSQQVMLDFELAMLYGVETKALNQAVKRNINRFPDDFMFQLTKNELESLRSCDIQFD